MALRRIALAPRLWLFALVLTGQDAPFEAFEGVWGVSYLSQAVGMSSSKAALFTSALAVLAAASQLSSGPICAVVKRHRQRSVLIIVLGLLGVAGFVPFVLGLPSLADAVVGTSVVLLGLSGGITSIAWVLISSDPLCNGLADSGLVSGFVNTIVMGVDAVVQSLVGVIMDVSWDGEYASDDDGGGSDDDDGREREYGAGAYGGAFLLCAVVMAAAAGSGVALCVAGPAGVRHLSSHGRREGAGGGV